MTLCEQWLITVTMLNKRSPPLAGGYEYFWETGEGPVQPEKLPDITDYDPLLTLLKSPSCIL